MQYGWSTRLGWRVCRIVAVGMLIKTAKCVDHGGVRVAAATALNVDRASTTAVSRFYVKIHLLVCPLTKKSVLYLTLFPSPLRHSVCGMVCSDHMPDNIFGLYRLGNMFRTSHSYVRKQNIFLVNICVGHTL